MAKKNPIAAAAKKMAAAPVSNSVVTEVKAAEVKAETKTEAPKAEEPKKETKKAPAKRAAAKDIKTSVVVQFAGKEVTEKELIAAVKKAYTKKGNKVGDIKTIEIYVKPEENAAYYVVNGVGMDTVCKRTEIRTERPSGFRRALLKSGDYGKRDEERTAGRVCGEDGEAAGQ